MHHIYEFVQRMTLHATEQASFDETTGFTSTPQENIGASVCLPDQQSYDFGIHSSQ
jgi:hypothetical protein